MMRGGGVAVLRELRTHALHTLKTRSSYILYGTALLLISCSDSWTWTYRADLSCASSFAASPLSGPSNTSKIERSALHERSEPRVTQRGRSDHSGRSVSPSRLCKVCGSTWLVAACAWIELTVRVTPLSRALPAVHATSSTRRALRPSYTPACALCHYAPRRCREALQVRITLVPAAKRLAQPRQPAVARAVLMRQDSTRRPRAASAAAAGVGVLDEQQGAESLAEALVLASRLLSVGAGLGLGLG